MRRIVTVLVLVVATTVATLAGAGVASAAPAGAPQQWNPVSGIVPANGGVRVYGTLRHVTTTGYVYVDLQNNVDGGLCVGLSFDGRTMSRGPVCYAAGEYGQKTMPGGRVAAGTAFYIAAYKRSQSGTNNDWGGRMYY